MVLVICNCCMLKDKPTLEVSNMEIKHEKFVLYYIYPLVKDSRKLSLKRLIMNFIRFKICIIHGLRTILK